MGADGDHAHNENVTGVTVTGGAGNDLLVFRNYAPNTGGNIATYAEGDGNDTITGFGASDTLKITSGEISSAIASGTSVILTIGSGSITLKDMINKPLNIALANGSVTQTVVSNFNITGTDGSENIQGYSNVTINAGAGDDYIAGADEEGVSITGATVIGGTGNDTISFYNNSDGNVVSYADGDGDDTVSSFGSHDTLHISSGAISSASISGVNVILKVGSGTILLKEMVNRTLNLKLANGEVQQTVIGTNSLNVTGEEEWGVALGAPNATIVGTDADDKIINNHVTGATIIGGKGNDGISFEDYYAEGDINTPTGNNIVVWAAGDGNDTIRDFGTENTFYITSGEVSSGTNVLLNICGETITFTDAINQTLKLRLADGTLLQTVVSQHAFNGTDGDDNIFASKRYNRLTNVTVDAAGGYDQLGGNADSS